MATSIDISESAGVRYLHFGSEWVQGAMRIRSPYALELAYTREMMTGLLFREPPWPREALVIGLGAGSVVKFLHHHCPDTRIEVVEIEAGVHAAARQFFAFPAEDKRLRVRIGDGVDHVLSCSRRYDCILVDGFDSNARAGGLDTLPFYQAARSVLTDRGLLAVNLFGRSRGFRASVDRIVEAFDGRALAFPSCDTGNVIAFAGGTEPVDVSLAELRERALHLKADTGLDLLPTVSRLEASGRFPGGRLSLGAS
jgi:spermidine synthase